MNSQIKLGPWILDTETGELTQQNEKISLPRQQHQLLMALVSAGQNTLVTREKIISILWPDDRVVEFDQSLNASMRKLRRALRDNSDTPIFIETVTGKGYRLVVEPAMVEAKAYGMSNRVVATLILLMLFVVYQVFWPKGPMEKVAPVLAVMPITTVPTDIQDPLALSLREELLNQFSRAATSDLIILAPGSIASTDASTKPTAAIYLYTSISQDPINKRIHLRLVNRAETQIWSQSFDWLKGGGTLSYQSIASQVTQSIAKKLDIVIPQTGAPEQILSQKSLTEFNHGLFLLEKASTSDLINALEKFQNVLVDFPNYAPSLAKLAHIYTKLVSLDSTKRFEHFAQSEIYAKKALALDQSNVEAWVALAYFQFYRNWDYGQAKISLDNAIAISPNYAEARSLYAAWHASQSDMASSISQARMAKRIDPKSMTVSADLCWYLNFARQFNQAELECSHMLSLQPNATWTRLGLVEAYAKQQKWTKAVQQLRLVIDDKNAPVGDPNTFYSSDDLALLYKNWSLKLLPLYESGKIDAYFIATLMASSTDHQKSINWLQTAMNDRNGFMVFVGIDPRFDQLREHTDFAIILKTLYPDQ